MNDEKPAPNVVRLTVGAPLAPEPHNACYENDIPEGAFELIDATHPQDVASQGRMVSAFAW